MLDLTSYMTLRDSHNSEPPFFFNYKKKDKNSDYFPEKYYY